MDICKRIRAGALSVNGGMSITGNLPFGGYKQSGVGREWGLEGIEELTELKANGARVSDRKRVVEGKSVSARVANGGRRHIRTKTQPQTQIISNPCNQHTLH